MDLLSFVPLAILCNTAVPLAFDPVLIFFASRQPSSAAIALALIGSGCAGLAAVADVRLFSWFHAKSSERVLRWLPHWRRRHLYVLTFLFALLPLPFSIVRAAVLRDPPAVIPYGMAVFLGRLPRYLVTVTLWPVLGLPSYIPVVLLLVGLIVGLAKVILQATSAPAGLPARLRP